VTPATVPALKVVPSSHCDRPPVTYPALAGSADRQPASVVQVSDAPARRMVFRSLPEAFLGSGSAEILT
jgi:hypothetical protein